MNYLETVNIYNQKLEKPEFTKIQEFMLKNLGVKLSPIKIVMVNSRLIKRLRASGIHTFPDYINYVLSPEGKRSGELQCMIDELTTHKTEFFREKEHFDFLQQQILPEFIKKSKLPFKIWSAGCSSGEEAYTLAIVLFQFKSFNLGFDFTIYASDVSNAVVIKAVKGIYSRQAIKNMNANLVRRYFMPVSSETNNQVKVNQMLRDKINFSVANLASHYNYSFNSFDVVFCRNTLIYFDDKSKRDVVNRLIQTIKPGGYLFVGLSETISQYSSEIKQVSPSIYKKIG